MDLAPTRQVGAHSCRRREKRSRSNLFFFGRRPCGCVDRRSASEQESSSDEKPTRMPHDVPMAAHETLLLYLYYQPPHHHPSLTSSPDARQRQRRAASSRRSSLSFRSLQAFGVAISLLFSPSLFPFLFPVCRAPTSTPPSGQPSSASSLLHCAYRINLLPLQANVPCSPAASSASFRCNVTPTTTGTLWIDHSTRCWYVLDHQVERSFSHQHLH